MKPSIRDTKADGLDAKFVKFAVSKKIPQSDSGKSIVKDPGKIDIILAYIETSSLPYKEEKYLRIKDYCRENVIRVVARGEFRDYEEIKEAGGIHPHPTASEAGDAYCETAEKILNVQTHRRNMEDNPKNNNRGTGFVSCTSSMRQTKISSYHSKFVYLIKAVGAVPPSKRDFYNENEYSLVGGCDLSEVIAVRKLAGETDDIQLSFSGSPIYISKDFIESYPWALPKMLAAYLEDDECCELSTEISEKLKNTPEYKLIPPVPPAKVSEESATKQEVSAYHFFKPAAKPKVIKQEKTTKDSGMGCVIS